MNFFYDCTNSAGRIKDLNEAYVATGCSMLMPGLDARNRGCECWAQNCSNALQLVEAVEISDKRS